MVTQQQEAKDGLAWLEKYIAELEQERDYLDGKCAELEKRNAILELQVAEMLDGE
jgi:hypothetical protein